MNNSSIKENKNGIVENCFDFLEIIVICTAIIIICFSFFSRLTVVSGTSMVPTLLEGDVLITSDTFYTPEQGDIIVVQDTSLSNDLKKPLVKRVIATAGQTIDIDFDTWTVTVDGITLDEKYVNYFDKNMGEYDVQFPLTVPEDEIFVMGDNRTVSCDSRRSEVGTIKTECVVGKVLLRIFPFNKICSFS